MELKPRVPRFDVIGGGEGSGALGHEVYVVFEISGREVYRRYPETLCQYLTHWVGGSWGCYCHSLSQAVRQLFNDTFPLGLAALLVGAMN